MKLKRMLIALVPAVAIATLVLLAAMLTIARSASAQGADTPTCSTGAAVPDPANNPGLVSDCEILLAVRDTLASYATLDWSAATPITHWEGVTVEGTPQRVTKLWFDEDQLAGTIPAELGSLSNLQWLWLN